MIRRYEPVTMVNRASFPNDSPVNLRSRPRNNLVTQFITFTSSVIFEVFQRVFNPNFRAILIIGLMAQLKCTIFPARRNSNDGNALISPLSDAFCSSVFFFFLIIIRDCVFRKTAAKSMQANATVRKVAAFPPRDSSQKRIITTPV